MLPFHYIIRSVMRAPARFFQQTFGVALVVALLLGAVSFNEGMDRLLVSSGSKHNVIFVGAGSEESVERSEVSTRAETLIAAGVRGIETRLGVPAVSGEVHYMGLVGLPDGSAEQGLLRGVTVEAFEVHREVRILKGRFPRSGEVMLGRLAAYQLGSDPAILGMGSKLEFEGQSFEVVGIFDAPGTVMESEIWIPRTDLQTLTQRDNLSCVILRLEDAGAFRYADLFAKQRLDLELSAVRESDYYRQLSKFYGPIRWMTLLTAAMIAVGAVFGGLNMLYAAYASRIQELAALQTIGYSRIGLFWTLIQESLLSAALGILIALLLGLWLLEGTMVPFSIGTILLGISASNFLIALLVGLLLAVVGVTPPALKCLRTDLPVALRSA
ncbi:MAG: ABC transporter permease [Puniceicoccaceae bacterium]